MLTLVCFLVFFNAVFGQTCDQMCTEEYQPVCGTDYRTYSNLCFLGVAECKAQLAHQYLTLAYSGPCSVSHSGETISTGQKRDDNCGKICTDDYQPVCGTDYRTYSNLCLLGIAECKAQLTHQYLTLAHSGPCSVSHSGGIISSGGTPNVNCDLICDDEVGQGEVCATDGKTYDNTCQYDNARCLAQKKGVHLSVRHTGACTDNDVFCPLFCEPDDVSPVCSARNSTYHHSMYMYGISLSPQPEVESDKIYMSTTTYGVDYFKDYSLRFGGCSLNSYDGVNTGSPYNIMDYTELHISGNACYLEQLRCRYAKIPSLAASFELAHNGSCDGVDPKVTHKLDCSPYETSAMIAVEGGHHNPLMRCPRIYKPVCGTDLITHTNACYYCQSMKATHQVAADNTVPVIVDKACPSYLMSHSPISSVIG